MPERSLGQWLAHLEGLHPKAIDLGLNRVAGVARALQLTPCAFPVLSIAGTNGKGTVAYSCDALLNREGWRCGRYTSPHLLAFSERITVGGEPVADNEIVAAFEEIERARGDTTLTYFEYATLAALVCFRSTGVDAAILEVGLGGRLDAVNIVDADVAVITAIDLDHQDWLGSSLDAIGREKAGIARGGQPVVLAEATYPASVGAALDSRGARALRAGREWQWSARDAGARLDVTLCDGQGSLQDLPVPDGLRPANVAAAVQGAALLLGRSPAPGPARAALAGLAIPGRRQRLQLGDRELVLDVAHNPAAMGALASWLRRHRNAGSCYAAVGMMADKDLPAMAAALAPAVRGACAVALPGVARAQSAERIWQVLDTVGVAVTQSEFTVDAVWAQLLAGSEPGDRIVFCGSFHTVAGIMEHLEISTNSP